MIMFKTLQINIVRLVFILLTYCAFQSSAMADCDYSNNRCDVVEINGTGTMLPDGRIVGSDVLSIIGSDKKMQLDFSVVTLGVIDVDQTTGGVTLSTSHDFQGSHSKKINFSTFDEISIVPLGGSDATCTQNACGLVFKLKLVEGYGRYNCGEIVSGFNTDPSAPVPFTSYVNPLEPAGNGDTVFLNSIGKLCHCSGKN